MFNNVHIIARDQLANAVEEWDVRTVEGGEFVGVIERFVGPNGCTELDAYTFTDTFGHMTEFDTIYNARDFAEQSINPTVVN